MATPRRSASTLVTSRSPKRIVPAEVSSSPQTQRSRVVLPHPDGPTMTVILPAGQVSERSVKVGRAAPL